MCILYIPGAYNVVRSMMFGGLIFLICSLVCSVCGLLLEEQRKILGKTIVFSTGVAGQFPNTQSYFSHYRVIYSACQGRSLRTRMVSHTFNIVLLMTKSFPRMLENDSFILAILCKYKCMFCNQTRVVP